MTGSISERRDRDVASSSSSRHHSRSGRDHQDRRDRDRDREGKDRGRDSSNRRRSRSPGNDRHHSERDSKRHRKRSGDEADKRTSHNKRDDLHSDSSSDSEEDQIHPKLIKLNCKPINSDDYFQKSSEFKAWLMSGSAKSSGKKLYLDEMNGRESRKWFEKFVKAWNKGKLIDAFYLGEIRTAATAASSQTRHKWNFTSNSTYNEKEKEVLESIRDSVDSLTNSNSKGAIEAREIEKRLGKGKKMTERGGEEGGDGNQDSGWNRNQSSSSTLVSHPSDMRYEKEVKSDLERIKRIENRKRENQSIKEEREELNPRSTGRDAIIEKRRNLNMSNREFAERKREDDGLDVDDGVLMGGGDDFASALASREKNKSFKSDRRSQRAQERAGARDAEKSERLSTLKAKETDTMEMFKQLAAQKFGSKEVER